MEPTTSPPSPPSTTIIIVTCALCKGRGWYRVARLLTRQGDIIENAQMTCGECKGTGQIHLPL